uniref:SNF2 N-terminal domain-containing protein n=1 Tax=Acrobeloides nanus TaxID=290746 RepID=A0A914DG96_9BILA
MNVEDIIRELKSSGLILRTHQVDGIQALLNWQRHGHGGILADEMGLGKTCQGIIALTILSSQGKGPSIVICPLSVLEHWENELL